MNAAGELSYWQKCYIERVKNHVPGDVMDFHTISNGSRTKCAARKLMETLCGILSKATGEFFNIMQQIDKKYLPKKITDA